MVNGGGSASHSRGKWEGGMKPVGKYQIQLGRGEREG